MGMISAFQTSSSSSSSSVMIRQFSSEDKNLPTEDPVSNFEIEQMVFRLGIKKYINDDFLKPRL